MEDERVPKMVLKGKLLNTRPAGKPRKMWDNVIQMGISQILGIQG